MVTVFMADTAFTGRQIAMTRVKRVSAKKIVNPALSADFARGEETIFTKSASYKKYHKKL